MNDYAFEFVELLLGQQTFRFHLPGLSQCQPGRSALGLASARPAPNRGDHRNCHSDNQKYAGQVEHGRP